MVVSRTPKADPEPQPLNREQSVQGLFQMLAAVPLVVSNSVPKDKPELRTALLADSAAIAMYAKPIGKGAAELAVNDPRFAKVLDKVIQAGPYGVLLIPVFQLGAQLAANHKVIEPGVLGTVESDALIASVVAEEERSGETDKSPTSNSRPPAFVSP